MPGKRSIKVSKSSTVETADKAKTGVLAGRKSESCGDAHMWSHM